MGLVARQGNERMTKKRRRKEDGSERRKKAKRMRVEGGGDGEKTSDEMTLKELGIKKIILEVERTAVSLYSIDLKTTAGGILKVCSSSPLSSVFFTHLLLLRDHLLLPPPFATLFCSGLPQVPIVEDSSIFANIVTSIPSDSGLWSCRKQGPLLLVMLPVRPALLITLAPVPPAKGRYELEALRLH
ncbi:hypothetical protein OPV22_020782 [Ensete ventricosum]|uniref:Uncharacterized protein n=1 Tax=Ensete ventricosum TaxID=4639 RepID=A0AAV8QNV0_ENSVE|nr:hypothetical protein OPV22_020782 [Ensete ventricosum]